VRRFQIVRLKEGKERSSLRRHPWILIYDGVRRRRAGDTVRLKATAASFWLGVLSARLKIRARVWSFTESLSALTPHFFIARCTASFPLDVSIFKATAFD
jgi:23S rRNA (cytosine1962-C5)-methyltransferase